MVLHPRTSWLVALVVVVIGCFNVVVMQIEDEQRRKSWLFFQITMLATSVLGCILRFYLYPFIFTNVSWSAGSVIQHLLRSWFYVMSLAVLSVYPMLRAGTALLPRGKEPHFMSLAGFTLFGFFLIAFVVSAMADIAERLVFFVRSVVDGGPRPSANNQVEPIVTEASNSSDSSASGAAPLSGGVRGRARRRVEEALPSPQLERANVLPSPAPKTSTGSHLWQAVVEALRWSRIRPPTLPLLCLLVASVICVAAAYTATLPPQVVQVHVTLPRLPKELDGFRIAQISDVHIGPSVGFAQLKRVVSIANSLEADMIALTGDFIDGDESTFEESLTPLRELKTHSRYHDEKAVFFVSGNHDHYDGSYPEKMRIISSLGVTILSNEVVQVPRGADSTFDLVGVSDWSASPLSGSVYATNLTKAMVGTVNKRESILLAHQPKHIHQAAAAGIGLQLSGHTHGGQIFPLHVLVYLGNPYFAGLYMHDAPSIDSTPVIDPAVLTALHEAPHPKVRSPLRTDVNKLANLLQAGQWVTQLYVNKGSIYWGPPMRLFAMQEITLITLHSATQ
jgi:predicted MPP superfamily phosphohydrolase